MITKIKSKCVFIFMVSVILITLSTPGVVSATAGDVSLTLTVNYTGNYSPTSASHIPNMSNNIFVGTDSAVFGTGSVSIPLVVNGSAVIDGDSTDNVAGLHVIRKNGYVQITAYGFGGESTRETVRASFSFSNASITNIQNINYEDPSGTCGVIEGNDRGSNPGNDQFTWSGSSGTLCSTTSVNEDKMKIFYAITQPIINHDHRACYNDDVYWFSSTNTRNDLYQDCTANQTCVNGECVTNVINHDHRACYNNDVYWFSSSNTRNDLYQDCTVNQNCVNGECIDITINHDHRACYNNDVYWFSSSNTRNDLYQDCTVNQNCENGVCVNMILNHDHKACYNNDVYWFDSNNTRNDIYQDCTYDQTCQNGACVDSTINHSYTQCYDNNVYWYNSAGVRQELFQTCTNNNYNNGANYCIGNSVYRQGYSNGGCSNGACYNTGNNNAQLVQTCAYNQTCQNGYCVNTINYNDHRGCYNNSVYWFDTYNTRQGLIQTCLSNQTCQGGYCVTTYIPPVIPPVSTNYRGCYNNDIYWFSGSTNVRLNLYRSCQDSNTCTFDSCNGTTCTNLLKCDGTTCAKGSPEYISQCTVCGDGTCSEGETIQSCAQDCNVIGLAVTIFGKRENDPVQWTKSFSANASQNLDYLLVVSNGLDTTMNDVFVKANLPSEVLYKGGLKLDGNDYSGDVRAGITLGSLAPKSTRTITYKAQVVENNSIFGNEASTLATVTTSAGSSQDTATVILNRTDTNNNNGGTVFVPQQGLAGLLGLNLSNPLYLFLIIIIIILVLLGIARMIQGFRRD